MPRPVTDLKDVLGAKAVNAFTVVTERSATERTLMVKLKIVIVSRYHVIVECCFFGSSSIVDCRHMSHTCVFETISVLICQTVTRFAAY